MQDSTQNKQHSVLPLTLNLINTITHLLLGAVAFGAIAFGNMFHLSYPFKQHIQLCVIGYIILVAQAVLTMNPYNSWSVMLTQQNRNIIHWVMQVLGSVLAIAGSIVQLTNNSYRFQNFSSAHGILGIIAMVLTILSLIGGVVNIFSSRLRLNVNLFTACHTCLGCFILIIAFLSLCFGFHNFYRVLLGNANANLLISLTVLASIGIIVLTFMGILSRKREQ